MGSVRARRSASGRSWFRRAPTTFGELTDPPWRGPLPHGADQDDDGAQVYLSAQEAHRRGHRSLPATIAVTAEAQSEALELGYRDGRSSRLPKIVGRVQASPAGTAFLAGFLGEIFVDRQQKRPEAGGGGQIVIHGFVLRSRDKPRSTPLGNLDQVIELSEGNFVGSLSDLAQPSRISPRLPWPRTPLILLIAHIRASSDSALSPLRLEPYMVMCPNPEQPAHETARVAITPIMVRRVNLGRSGRMAGLPLECYPTDTWSGGALVQVSGDRRTGPATLARRGTVAAA